MNSYAWVYKALNQVDAENMLKNLQLFDYIMVLWFMTGNKGKVIEAAEHFSKYGIVVKQFDFEAIEPQAEDLESVALAKIEQAIPHLPDPEDMLLVEDAGLFIDALDGFPGVYSSSVSYTHLTLPTIYSV